jgi:hypothetical protein
MLKEAVAAGVCVSAAWLFAQVDTNAVGTLVGNLGAVGAVIWLVYHTQTKVLPSIVQDFRAELAAVRAAHQAELASLRNWHHEELELLRQTLERDSERDERSMAALSAAIQQLSARLEQGASRR